MYLEAAMKCPRCEHESPAAQRFCGKLRGPAGHFLLEVRCRESAGPESVKQYAEEIRRSAGVPVLIRVGLNSGEVVVRSIRSDLHMDYTAVGRTTHLAARMEQAAVPGSTLLTAETLHLAEGYVAVKPLGPVTVKGLSEAVEVYELTGAGTARTRLRVSAALTRFVGRDAEIALLRRALEKTARGQGTRWEYIDLTRAARARRRKRA